MRMEHDPEEAVTVLRLTAGSQVWHRADGGGRAACCPRTKVRGPVVETTWGRLWGGWNARRFHEMTDSKVWEFAYKMLCKDCFPPQAADDMDEPVLPPEASWNFHQRYVKWERDEPLHDFEKYPVCRTCFVVYDARRGGCPTCEDE